MNTLVIQGGQRFLNSLNCKWFFKNLWNNEFLRICSWNVFEFYFSSFIKTLLIFLKLIFLYRFQVLFYDAKTCNFVLVDICISWNLSLVIMRLSFFKKTFKSIVMIFSPSLMFLKIIDMFWNILEFLNFQCKNCWPPCHAKFHFNRCIW